MAWLFWGLFIGIVGGLWLMWFLSRRRKGFRYGSPRPPMSRMLWAFGHAFRYGLWGMGARYRFFRAEPPNDQSDEYVSEFERDLGLRGKDDDSL